MREGVFADEEVAEVRDGFVDHVGDDAALGLSESGESFVGVDGDEDPGVAGSVSDVGVYGGDFHVFLGTRMGRIGNDFKDVGCFEL